MLPFVAQIARQRDRPGLAEQGAPPYRSSRRKVRDAPGLGATQPTNPNGSWRGGVAQGTGAQQAWLDEGKGMSESLAQAGAVNSFGAVPLIVLSRGLIVEPDQDWQRMQTELLGLSSSSQQLFADKSGHNIEFDQPEAAVGAIEKMVEQTREQAAEAGR